MKNLAPDGRGEILLKGPSVFKEYWANLDATDKAFSDGWFHTGDVGHFDDEGYLYIVDRMKDIVVVGASNVYRLI